MNFVEAVLIICFMGAFCKLFLFLTGEKLNSEDKKFLREGLYRKIGYRRHPLNTKLSDEIFLSIDDIRWVLRVVSDLIRFYINNFYEAFPEENRS